MMLTLCHWLLAIESLWAAALVPLLAGGMILRRARLNCARAAARHRDAIYRALAIYVGGNRDLEPLRALAAASPEEFQQALQDFQTAVAGRCDEIGELALRMRLVSRWCDAAQTGNLEERRTALRRIASVAQFGPVYPLARDVAAEAIGDSDEQVRLAAARVLVHSRDRMQIAQLFNRLLGDTRLVRAMVGPELRVHAAELCGGVVLEALRHGSAREIVCTLEILHSWERAVPLDGFGYFAAHPDAVVRREFLRLLPILPATREHRQALADGLADAHPGVRAAAAIAARRMNFSGIPGVVPGILACAGGAA